MKENKKENNRIVLSEDKSTRNSQLKDFVEKTYKEHKELIDALASGGSDEE